jgi:hypothetical protein
MSSKSQSLVLFNQMLVLIKQNKEIVRLFSKTAVNFLRKFDNTNKTIS